MIIRKTQTTKKRDEYKTPDAVYKHTVLYNVTTWWFLFIPVYSKHDYLKF